MSLRNSTFRLLVVLATLAFLLPGLGSDPGGKAAEATGRGVTPTLLWVNFFGLSSTLNGSPLPAGTRITAYDPQGVESGEFVVGTPGRYGLMPVYGDDLTTPEDEGASPDDVITFRVNGIPARTLGPDEPRWTATGDLKHVELAAEGAPPAVTPGVPTATSVPIAPSPAPATSAPFTPTSVAALPTPTGGATQAPAVTGTALASTPARTATPGPAGSTATPSSGGQVTPTSAPRSGDTPSPAGTATPDSLAILGMASPTPAGGSRPDSPSPAATPGAPGQQARPPVAPSQTAPNPTSSPASPQPPAGGLQTGADAGGLVVGAAIVIILVAALAWIRRRFL